MRKMRILLAVLAIVFCANGVKSQNPYLDPAIRYGVLENGMTYYIKHNEKPKERASFYIAHNVGAILEDDDQNGLAHMLEHMAFNGSTNFEGKGIKNFLERQGVEFGRNINAYTAQEETVYNISNVPTEKSSVMDSCVLILHDWSGSLTLSGKEIDAERGVVKEEWRSQNNAQRRMQLALAPTTFYKSKYARRDVIGDMEVIDNSPYSAIRSFYKKWYRPDLQAVLIMGDFDVDEMEKRVKRILSKIPKATNPAKRIDYYVTDNEGIIYGLATDEEAQYVQYSIIMKHRTAKREDKDLEYLKNTFVQSLYSIIVRERLGNIQQEPKAPFIGGQIGYFNYTRTMAAYAISGAKPEHIDLIGSMKAMLIENERLKRYGVTPTELERAKVALLKYYEESYKSRNEINNDQLASTIKDHYLTGDLKPSIEYEYELVRNELPNITVNQVNALAEKWNKKDNIAVTIQGPKNVGFDYPTEKEVKALFKDIWSSDIDPFIDNVVSAPLIAEEPKGGKVVSKKKLKGVEAATEYTLSNGARVVIYPTDKDENEVLFQAYSPGGTSLIPSTDLPSAQASARIFENSGLGGHDLKDLKQLLVGKEVRIQTRIRNFSEEINGHAVPEDIETLMKLIYMTFESPRISQESYDSYIDRLQLQVKNASKNPQSIFSDSLAVVTSGGRLDRRPIRNLEYVKNIKLNMVEAAYKDRFKNAGDFVFAFVGKIDEATLLPMIEKYIGAISDDGRREAQKDDGIRSYGNDYKKEFAIPMEVKKQTNYIKYQGERAYSRKDDLVLQVAEGILSQRYFETIREEEGGSYGVGVFGGYEKTPYPNFRMTMYFDCNPDKADKLVGIIYKQMNDLIKKGAEQKEFNASLESMVKNREQALEQNRVLIGGLMNYYGDGVNTLLKENYEDILANLDLKSFNKTFRKIMAKSDKLTVIMKPE